MPDNRGLIVRNAKPGNYEGGPTSATLFDTETNQATVLTRGLEQYGAATVSPDGRRMVMQGSSLRILTLGGRLERAIPVPEGSYVTTARWSPDGRSVAYVVGPYSFMGP